MANKQVIVNGIGTALWEGRGGLWAGAWELQAVSSGVCGEVAVHAYRGIYIL